MDTRRRAPRIPVPRACSVCFALAAACCTLLSSAATPGPVPPATTASMPTPAANWSALPDPVQTTPPASSAPAMSSRPAATASRPATRTTSAPATSTRPGTTSRPTTAPATRVTSAPAAAAVSPDDPTRTKVPYSQVVTFTNPHSLVAPNSPSRFLMTYVGMGSNQSGVELWDLKAAAKVADQPKLHLAALALSPDGQYAAADNAGIDFWAVRTGKLAFHIPEVKDAKTSIIGFTPTQAIIFQPRLQDEKWHGTLSLYQLATGTVDATADLTDYNPDLVTDLEVVGTSNNGKYFALVRNGFLWYYQTDSLKLLGRVELPPDPKTNGLSPRDVFHSLAFSTDGTRIALCRASVPFDYAISHQVNMRFLVYSATTGSQLNLKICTFPEFLPGSLSWSPDNALLLFGHSILDAASLTLVADLPPRNAELLTRWADPNTILFLYANGSKIAFETLPLDRGFVARALAAIALGGSMADANLPPMIPLDFANARTPSLAPPETWRVPPIGPLPAIPAKIAPVLAIKPIVNRAIPSFSTVPSGILETSRTANLVFLEQQLHARGEGLPADARYITSYDLTTGVAGTALEVPALLHAIDASATGKTLLFRGNSPQDRLDLYSFDKGALKPLTAFRPFHVTGSSAEDPNRILFATLVDETHVLALSALHELALYEMPGAKQLWWTVLQDAPTNNLGTSLMLSPDRKLAVVTAKNGAVIFDPLKGEALGSLVAASPINGFAFSPDGKQLAGIASNENLPTLTVFDLQTGAKTAEFPLFSSFSNTPPVFVAPGYLLLEGHKLVSLEKKSVVWTYDGYNPLYDAKAVVAVSGRPWFYNLSRQNLFDPPLPHADALKAAQAINAEDLYELCPGMSVKLDITVIGDDKYRQQQITAWTEALKAHGITVADDAPRVLVARSFFMEGPPTVYTSGNETASVPNRTGGFEISLTNAGREIWKVAYNTPPSAQTYAPRTLFVTKEGNESFQDAVNKRYPVPTQLSIIHAPPSYIPKAHPESSCEITAGGFGPIKITEPKRP